MTSRAQNLLAYKETYLLIIDANIRRALFLGEVAAVMKIRIAQCLPCRRIARSTMKLAAAYRSGLARSN
jgi:hypothetical protein